MADAFRSGDALFACDADMEVLLWNREAERLTGIQADEAVGRRCWEVLHGVDERGSLICHAGCSGARLAREGWPVPCYRMVIRTEAGDKLVTVSTVAVRLPGAQPLVLQLLRNGDVVGKDGDEASLHLTPRQREVLRLLADGIPAKVIARRLGIAQVTVRNHIQAILTELRCHSQLEAVAEARRRHVL
ncbi:MAG: response regulator transcription factor [Gaiellaceae bacterium]